MTPRGEERWVRHLWHEVALWRALRLIDGVRNAARHLELRPFDLLLVLGILLALGAYWGPALLGQPVTYPNQPFPVANAPLVPGEAVVLDVERCLHWPGEVPYRLEISLRQADGPTLLYLGTAAGTITVEEDTCVRVSPRVLIPQHTPPGVYRLRILIFARTLVAEHRIDTVSAPFEVSARRREGG